MLRLLLFILVLCFNVPVEAAAPAQAQSPVLIRIFKQEHHLEVWESDKSGIYYLTSTYNICRYSGQLGPKLRRGDRQAPEGFYSILLKSLKHQHRMDIGYPNEFDKQHNRTGDGIQIHGNCTSIGCFAMTDTLIKPLYQKVSRALRSGQQNVQVHVYPFRMTDSKMQENISNKNYSFWQQLKVGYDKFESTRKQLIVLAVDGKYIVY